MLHKSFDSAIAYIWIIWHVNPGKHCLQLKRWERRECRRLLGNLMNLDILGMPKQVVRSLCFWWFWWTRVCISYLKSFRCFGSQFDIDDIACFDFQLVTTWHPRSGAKSATSSIWKLLHMRRFAWDVTWSDSRSICPRFLIWALLFLLLVFLDPCTCHLVHSSKLQFSKERLEDSANSLWWLLVWQD